MEHDESETGHEEVYVVLAGFGAFKIDGDEIAVEAGDYLRIEATATRQPLAGPEGCASSPSAAARRSVRRAALALT